MKKVLASLFSVFLLIAGTHALAADETMQKEEMSDKSMSKDDMSKSEMKSEDMKKKPAKKTKKHKTYKKSRKSKMEEKPGDSMGKDETGKGYHSFFDVWKFFVKCFYYIHFNSLHIIQFQDQIPFQCLINKN